MRHDHPFSQRNKAAKRAGVKKGMVGENLIKDGGR